KDRSNRREISRAQQFALDLLDYMELHKIKQIDLADKMGVTPQQVNKILRAKANLTFETLDKIADSLGATITSPRIKSNNSNYTQTVGSSMQVVHRRQSKIIQENFKISSRTKKNPILETSFENMNPYGYTAKQI